MKTHGFWAALAFAAFSMGPVAGTVSAAGLIYDCDINNRAEKNSWISPKVAVVVTDQGQVKVIDAVLIHFGQSPATARVERNTDRVLRARWRVRNARNQAGQVAPDFGYSLRLNKQNNTIVIGAHPHGYPENFSGRGSCTLRKQSSPGG